MGKKYNPYKSNKISYAKQLIFSHSPISRIEIADTLGVTQATISKYVSSLIQEGLVHEIEVDNNDLEVSMGRPPIMLEFVPDSKYIIGIEINPFGIFLAIFNACGEAIHKLKREVSNSNFEYNNYNYDFVLKQLVEIIKEGIKESKILAKKIAGISICLSGYIDSKQGIVNEGIWETWENKALVNDLSEIFTYNISIENNVITRAYSEAFRNTDRPSKFSYLYLSRGMSCPLIMKKDNLEFDVIASGEIGHMTVNIDGSKCSICGENGCLEVYTSEKAIIKKCIELLAKEKTHELSKIVSNPENPTIKEIISAAKKGDKEVINVLEQAVKYLSAGISNVIRVVNPELVIVDAYIMQLDSLKENLKDNVRGNLKGNRFNEVKFDFKEYDEFGGAKAAANYGIKKFIIDL